VTEGRSIISVYCIRHLRKIKTDYLTPCQGVDPSVLMIFIPRDELENDIPQLLSTLSGIAELSYDSVPETKGATFSISIKTGFKLSRRRWFRRFNCQIAGRQLRYNYFD
jgi:hypothetical protein